MASKYKCKTRHCQTYLDNPDYCQKHKRDQKIQKRIKDSWYDKKERNRESYDFYHSSEWIAARLRYLAVYPLCNRCKMDVANTVHHKTPLTELVGNERLNPIHLEAMCASCHSKYEKRSNGNGYGYEDLFKENSVTKTEG